MKYELLLKELEAFGNKLFQVIVQIEPLNIKKTPAFEEIMKARSDESQQTEQICNLIIDRVSNSVGYRPNRLNILKNLGTMVVEALPDFIRELIKQPEIINAVSNGKVDLIK